MCLTLKNQQIPRHKYNLLLHSADSTLSLRCNQILDQRLYSEQWIRLLYLGFGKQFRVGAHSKIYQCVLFLSVSSTANLTTAMKTALLCTLVALL